MRQRMIDDMMVRNFAPNLMLAYLKQVSYFARHFGRSPERLGAEDIRSYQIHSPWRVSISSRTVAGQRPTVSVAVTLQQDWVIEMIPTPKATNFARRMPNLARRKARHFPGTV